jgi:O-antigen biosynthesis protein WbqP
MIIIAFAIKLDSKGPILFRQVRLGKGMKPFTIYKFRTMCDHAYEMGGIANRSDDPRITKVGAFLRRTSLDEFPQMFNILNGTMVIIGPRPILDWEFEPYKGKANYIRRYEATPGMFSPVDVKYRASSDRDLQFKMDVEYIDNMSFWLDLKMVLQIAIPIITGKDVYREEVG